MEFDLVTLMLHGAVERSNPDQCIEFRMQQHLAERLGEKVVAAGFHAACQHRVVRLGRQKDDGSEAITRQSLDSSRGL